MGYQNGSSESRRTTPPSSKLSPKSVMIAEAIRGYRRIYPGYGETTDPDQVKLYFRLLEDLDEDALRKALAQAAKECTAFPTPAHIRQIAQRVGGATSEVEAEKALAWLDRLIEKWGVDRTPEYVGQSERYPDGFRRCPEVGGAIGHALASVGGWRAYASRTERDAPFMRRDFLESYTRYRSAGQKPCELIGAHAGEFALGLRQIAEAVTL